MAEYTQAHIIVSGIVQGVGFRYFTSRLAKRYGLTGWVRNTPEGKVEIEAEGEKGMIAGFLKDVHIGPSSSHVTTLDVQWKDYSGSYTDFLVKF